MPLAAFDKYKEIVIRFLDPSVLKKGVRAAILECYDDQKMGQMINFLRHPQIVSMTRREESSKSPQTAQAMQNFFSGLQASPPTEVRKRLIEKIDSVKHSSSFVVDMQAELFQAITWGMRGLSPADQRMTEEQLKQVALDMKAQLGTHMQQQVWMNMLFAYKDVSDNELEEYISLHESDEGKLTTEFIQSTYSTAHHQSVRKLQSELGVTFG